MQGDTFMIGKGGVRSQSVIPHVNYINILRDGWVVISFIDMSAKNAKPLQALLEGEGQGHIGKGAVRSE